MEAAYSAEPRIPPYHLTEVLSRDVVNDAWCWWIENIYPRNNLLDGQCCIFDQKRWHKEQPVELLWNNPLHVRYASTLCLVGWLGSIEETICMVLGEGVSSIRYPYPKLEKQYREVISGNPDAPDELERYRRFRHLLSESLAFWVQIAHLAQSTQHSEGIRFSISRPNFVPEKTGPDGLAITVNHDRPIVELRSVKSTINDPRS